MAKADFPKYQQIQAPLLAELAARGGSARPGDLDASGRSVYAALADHFALETAARSDTTKGEARSKWENMVRWARNDLRKAGHLDGSVRGVWTITNSGRTLLRYAKINDVGGGRVSENYVLSPTQFAEFQAEAAKIGDKGESFALAAERKRLSEAGRGDLAGRVKHVAAANVAAGYDIHSFEATGADRFIEVKATSLEDAPFFLTANEWNVAKRLGARYWLYRVTRVGSPSAELHQVQNLAQEIASGRLHLSPTAFSVSPAEVDSADV